MSRNNLLSIKRILLHIKALMLPVLHMGVMIFLSHRLQGMLISVE